MLCVYLDFCVLYKKKKQKQKILCLISLPRETDLEIIFVGGFLDSTSEPANHQTEDRRMFLFGRDCTFSVVVITITT